MSLFSKKEKPTFREIFISDENRKLRIILLCVFLGIGIMAIATGLMDFLSVDPGWQEVEAVSDSTNCAEDFTLQYYFTDSGAAASGVQKDMINLYSQAVHKAYQMFTPDQAVEGMGNVYAINHRVNQEVTVDPVLYDAFSLLQEYGNRNLYLGPVYQQYNNIFFSGDDANAAYWDPDLDAESKAYVKTLAAFAADANAVDLVLLEDNRVMLKVSQDYLSFAQEHEIENFIDFHWMTNAFIIDYFAQLLTEKGYTQGFIASRDGFTRNLNAGTDFSFNLFDKREDTIIPVGSMVYDDPISIVFLRAYPMTQEDRVNYYVYRDRSVTSSYVDLADGMDRTGAQQLVCYSGSQGCARILLECCPTFIGGSLDVDRLEDLAKTGTYSIWCEEDKILYTDPELELTNLLQDANYSYSASYFVQ